MIVRLLGLMDFLAGLLLILLHYGAGGSVGVWIGIFLLVKGVVFIANVVSFMDILAGIVMVMAAQGFTTPFTWIFVLWLLQKGFFSFFS